MDLFDDFTEFTPDYIAEAEALMERDIQFDLTAVADEVWVDEIEEARALHPSSAPYEAFTDTRMECA